MKTREVALTGPLDLRRTLRPVGVGQATARWEGEGWWQALWTSDGPASLRLEVRGGELRAHAWGPGAEGALEGVPALVGLHDDPRGFLPRGPVAALQRRFPGVRMPRTGRVLEILLPTILGQRVTVQSADRSWRALVARFGEPAPGPAPVRLPPRPEVLMELGYAALHPLGVERSRAGRLLRACQHARRLEEAAGMTPEQAERRLRAVPGIGPWTAAKVRAVALGDPDAVPVGDLHLPRAVAWLVQRETEADDDRMLELLEPYAGHRGRVIRLIEAAGAYAPRFAPPRPAPDIRRW